MAVGGLADDLLDRSLDGRLDGVGMRVVVDHDQARTTDGDGLLRLCLKGALDLAMGDLSGACPDDRPDRGRDQERRREEADDEAGCADRHRALLDDVVVLLDLHRAVQILAHDDQTEQRGTARLDGFEVLVRGLLGQVAAHQDVDGLLRHAVYSSLPVRR